ncbi:Histone transcription regulator 3-like protein [Bienertia sinuspersici]
MGKTFQLDADELCWWFLQQLVKKCGDYASVERIFYLNPGESLDGELRKVYSDNEVREMGAVALKWRSIELYVQHGVDEPVMADDGCNLIPTTDKPTRTPAIKTPTPTHLAGPSNSSPKKSLSKSSPNKVTDKPTRTPAIKTPTPTHLAGPSNTSPKKSLLKSSPNKVTDKPTRTPAIKTPTPTHLPGPSNTSPKKSLSKPSLNKVVARADPPLTRSMISLIKESQTQVPPNKDPDPNVITDPSTTDTPNKQNKSPPTKTATPATKTKSDAGPSSKQPQPIDSDKEIEAYSDDCYDDRPESLLCWKDLVGDYSTDEGSDELYNPDEEPLSDEEHLSEEEELINTEPDPQGTEFQEDIDQELELAIEGSEGDTSDEEFQKAREGLRGFNSKLWQITSKLQQEAEQGQLQSQKSSKRTTKVKEGLNKDVDCLSDYQDSEEECNTPDGSDEDSVGVRIRKERKVVSADKIEYNTFQWKVGQRFPSRKDFRAAVTRFAIAQGRDLFFSVSCRKRNQRLAVKCKSGCPFRMYASWHNNSASFMVKSVDGDHTCNRTMGKNRQLKCSWLAEQFLDVFKSRPHWPATEIIETVRRAYRVVISRDKAYKVKYLAHKKLHGSMTEHYQKLGNYVAALEKACPNSTFLVQHDPKVVTLPPVFQRVFVSFDGLKNGWLNGCRKILCVDG